MIPADAYISLWSIILWTIAAVVALGTVATIFGPSEAKKNDTILGGLILALLFVGGGYATLGSKSERDAARAGAAVAKAQRDLMDANYELCGRPACPGGAY
jgi:hypothetical protein